MCNVCDVCQGLCVCDVCLSGLSKLMCNVCDVCLSGPQLLDPLSCVAVQLQHKCCMRICGELEIN